MCKSHDVAGFGVCHSMSLVGEHGTFVERWRLVSGAYLTRKGM